MPGRLQTKEVADIVNLEAVKHVIATIFSAQNALRELAPEFKWAGMGNLLGDYGELVAITEYNLVKAPPGSEGFDALMADGRTVQIKANHSSSTIGFRGSADLLLVLRVEADGTTSELFFGPFEQAISVATYSSRDNKHTLSISKLKKLANGT